ncbi:lectin BRA-3, partial [Biomphalaria glabrata]
MSAASCRVHHVGCIMSGASCRLHHVGCIMSGASRRLHHVGCITSGASRRVHHVRCIMSAASRRVHHVGCITSGASCPVHHVGCITSGASCPVHHVGCIMSGASCRVHHVGCIMSGASCRVHHVGCIMSAASCRVHHVGCIKSKQKALSHLTNSLIFIITYFLVVNKLVDCQLCQSGMTYHRHTHSCMIAVHSYLHYEEAKEYCARTYSGGHLVYILDKETDTFIKKNLIADQYWYYIGLSDKEENGVYKWINEKNVSYTGWYSKSHTPQRNKDYVVATVDGWIEVTDRSTKFICQSVAARSLSFSLNQQDFVNSTWDIVALTTNTFRCEVYDIDAHHLQLLYQNSDGTLSKIDDKLGKSLTYTFRPGFNSSGVYVCQIGQQHEGEIASLTGTLKVI